MVIVMRICIFLLVTMLSLVGCGNASNDEFGEFKNVKYISNYDGDTIRVNIPYVHPLLGNNISIRVNGIDTPEIKGKCLKEKTLAKEAKNVVRDKLVTADSINLVHTKRGKYFRIVADVIVDGCSLSEMLINKGLAVPYDGGTKTHNWCE
jgi:endonuclease YncB( thermonuclease family)